LDALTTVRRRLFTQRLAGRPFDTSAEAVRWLGAVQAQEFAEAQWSLAQRSLDRTVTDVDAAFDRGDILRTHVLRPTWHFVHQTDIRWLLRLTRPRVHALNRYWYAKFGLDGPTLARGHDVLADALEPGRPLTRRELAGRLQLAGVEADGLRLGYLLMHAELEELVCSGPRRGRQQTYLLLDLRAPAAGALLVPMYDETIVAYQDLRVVLAHRDPAPGQIDRAVVIDGRTVGSWRRTLGRRSVLVDATLFGPLSTRQSTALDAAVERFGRFLGLPAALRTSTVG